MFGSLTEIPFNLLFGPPSHLGPSLAVDVVDPPINTVIFNSSFFDPVGPISPQDDRTSL